ncbi:MAG: exodeoxyribonuclease VII large subunit [Bacteroidota bacterium]
MPEEKNDKKVFSLLQVMQSIRQTLADRYKSSFWVKAEMNKLNYYAQSGHCFPELVEKKDGRVIAQVRSTLWSDDFLRINRSFQSIVKEPLKDGIKILFLANITFDPCYGLNLRITDIDPSYSLGDLEMEKAETIEKLKQQGIYLNNKLFKLPLLPKRLAIISVDSSKGYGDFMNVLGNNDGGYIFFHMLFPALLQGERAIDSIIGQLRRIKKVQQYFDVVAIIRGGGDDIGLSCYNNFRLAKEVALFSLPVITGIGHSTNETVVEMVAFENAITPTKLAEYLLQKFHNYAVPLLRAEEKVIDLSKKMLRDERLKFKNATRYFRSVTSNFLITGNNDMVNMRNAIQQQVNFRFKSQFNELNNLERTINNLSPENVLKRGYSITLLNGKAVTSYKDVQKDDMLETRVLDGIILGKVSSTKKLRGT